MTNFDIKIISDTVCPFCYLGAARLDRAIALYRKTVPGGSTSVFTIRWSAFRLDSDPPAASVPVREVAAKRFGADRLAAKSERMAQLGASEGFNFTFAGRIGATRDSHRVVHLGRSKGGDVEDRVAREVMRMFFEEGGDITAWDDLVGAAERAGIRPEETRRWLEDGMGGDEVDAEVEEAERMGLKGVPTFVVNGKHVVDGAEDVFGFMELFARVDEEAQSGEQS